MRCRLAHDRRRPLSEQPRLSVLLMLVAALLPVLYAPDAGAEERSSAQRAAHHADEGETLTWSATVAPAPEVAGATLQSGSAWSSKVSAHSQSEPLEFYPAIELPPPVALARSGTSLALTGDDQMDKPQPTGRERQKGVSKQRPKSAPQDPAPRRRFAEGKGGSRLKREEDSVLGLEPDAQAGKNDPKAERADSGAWPATEDSQRSDKGGSPLRGDAAAAEMGPSNNEAEQRLPLSESGAGGTAKAVQSYCVNIANPALDARNLRQKKDLEDLRSDIDRRTTALEGKIAEYKSWLSRRDEFASKARDSLVSIYASMKAEPAAKQLAELDEMTASSLLWKLDSRQASAILGEMDPKNAARLMQIVSGAGRLPEPAGTSAEGKSAGGSETPPAVEESLAKQDKDSAPQ